MNLKIKNNMKKEIVRVPKGVRYISEWSEFSLPESPMILNKQLTGCGFTEYCLSNDLNVILVSPRRILLENKKQHHPESNVFYFMGDDTQTSYDKNLDKPKVDKVQIKTEAQIREEQQRLIENKESLKILFNQCRLARKPCKILVTYDSFRHIKEVLKEGEVLGNFYVVVDEFQSIFIDSKFKSTTEMELLWHLQDIQRLCFVSATPMIDKYLDMLPEFNQLPYYDLDWETEDPGRIMRPILDAHKVRSTVTKAVEIVKSYLSGEFKSYNDVDEYGKICSIESREAVLYFNSVKNICDIIRRCELKPDQCNVLCAKTEENEKNVRSAFGVNKRKYPNIIGRVPEEGEPHKMFTFCTRTVYLGADFYSTNARSFIFSDANIDCLCVDITLDLPQIIGRQRLDMNPWKNQAELYYKMSRVEKTEEEFMKYLEQKKEKTDALLRTYNVAADGDKHFVAESYQQNAKAYNYKSNFVAVNEHSGADILPVFNQLVMVSEMRSFEIQQVDYKDRFSLFRSLESNGCSFSESSIKINQAVDTYSNIVLTRDKLKYIQENPLQLSNEEMRMFLSTVSSDLRDIYYTLGPECFGAYQYNITEMKKEIQRRLQNQNIDIAGAIYSKFNPGERYLKSDLKIKLGNLYDSLGYSKTPKASDLEEYFELRLIRIENKETGKRDAGFEIIKKKE